MEKDKQKFNIKTIVAKFGIYGFMFFFVKGLVWIAIGALTYYFGDDVFRNIFGS